MNKKVIIVYTVITLAFFGLLYKMSYSTDTYSVFNFNEKEIFWQYASSGRFVTALIGKFIKNIGVGEKIIYALSYISAIIFAIISQYELYKITKKILIPTLIIINPFCIEFFLFIESSIMLLGVLLSVLAVQKFINYFSTQNKKSIIYSAILMFIANCCYQGVVGIFVTISLVYILKYSKGLKEFIKNNVIMSLIYGFPAILNYIMVKILYKTSRINGEINLMKSLKIIFKNVINMATSTYELLPKYVFILAILFTFVLFCCKIWKEQKKICNILKYFYIIFVTILVAVGPQLMQPTESIWFVPRATYCFGAMYGILILYLADGFKLNKINRCLILIVSTILLMLQFNTFTRIERDRYILNQKDEQIATKIINIIKQYEEQKGSNITNIAIYDDANPSFTYTNIFATGDINVKAFASNWSIEAIIEYYLKRDLKIVDKDKTINFSNKDWNEFSQNQIIIKNDTINLCKY